MARAMLVLKLLFQLADAPISSLLHALVLPFLLVMGHCTIALVKHAQLKTFSWWIRLMISSECAKCSAEQSDGLLNSTARLEAKGHVHDLLMASCPMWPVIC